MTERGFKFTALPVCLDGIQPITQNRTMLLVQYYAQIFILAIGPYKTYQTTFIIARQR